MNTSDAIDILRKIKVNFADKYGIKTLGLFSSFARKLQKETSDLDVVVI
ncbi:nucleotidyltransferase family protein [Bacteroides timonensis]|nr:nucleotidyltransferase domain-containing protein [Bacteroides timonensis]